MFHRISIFERDEAIRRRTRACLENAGFQICGEAGDGQEALAKTKVAGPAMIIMDLNGGVDLIPELLKCAPAPKILIFTLHEGPEFLRLARLLGAQGYALKSEPNGLTAEVRRLLGTTS